MQTRALHLCKVTVEILIKRLRGLQTAYTLARLPWRDGRCQAFFGLADRNRPVSLRDTAYISYTHQGRKAHTHVHEHHKQFVPVEKGLRTESASP